MGTVSKIVKSLASAGAIGSLFPDEAEAKPWDTKMPRATEQVLRDTAAKMLWNARKVANQEGAKYSYNLEPQDLGASLFETVSTKHGQGKLHTTLLGESKTPGVSHDMMRFSNPEIKDWLEPGQSHGFMKKLMQSKADALSNIPVNVKTMDANPSHITGKWFTEMYPGAETQGGFYVRPASAVAKPSYDKLAVVVPAGVDTKEYYADWQKAIKEDSKGLEDAFNPIETLATGGVGGAMVKGIGAAKGAMQNLGFDLGAEALGFLNDLRKKGIPSGQEQQWL